MPSESDFLAWLRLRQRQSALVSLAAGDDLAILRVPAAELILVGADQVLDGVHFDSSVHGPRDIGRKVMNRNLSDCAAMGCWPAAAVVTLALPRDRGQEFARELYVGIEEAGRKFGCEIVGGDTASWPGKLCASVTILGRAQGVEPVARAGAKAGDGIYVSGPLGGSIRGRHMTFEPRVELGHMLAEQKIATAMIDLSDGISRDLPRLCAASHVGAEIEAALVPIHDDAIALRRDGHTPVDHALHDGEDYELLFTAANTVNLPGVTRIGTIVSGAAITLIDRDGAKMPLEPRGWEHPLGA